MCIPRRRRTQRKVPRKKRKGDGKRGRNCPQSLLQTLWSFFFSHPLIPLSKVAFKAGRGEESGLRYDWAKCFPPLTEKRFCLSVRSTAAESVFFAPLTLRNGLEKRGGGGGMSGRTKREILFSPFCNRPHPFFLSLSFPPFPAKHTRGGAEEGAEV